jgi:hypothetical protein
LSARKPTRNGIAKAYFKQGRCPRYLFDTNRKQTRWGFLFDVFEKKLKKNGVLFGTFIYPVYICTTIFEKA